MGPPLSENSDAGPNTPAVTTKINCHMPVTGAWHFEAKWGSLDVSSEELVLAASAVIAEVTAIHEANVRRCGERDLYDFSTLELAEVVVNEVHDLRTPSRWCAGWPCHAASSHIDR